MRWFFASALTALALAACTKEPTATPRAEPDPAANPSSAPLAVSAPPASADAAAPVASSAPLAPLASGDAAAPVADSADAGLTLAQLAREREAAEHITGASAALQKRDGAGCIAELDKHDAIDPRPAHLSTSSQGLAMLRAQCLMLAGRCAEGRKFVIDVESQPLAASMGVDPQRVADSMVGMFCDGPNISPRDQLLRSGMELTQGAWTTKKDAKTCLHHYEIVRRVAPTLPPSDPAVKQSQDMALLGAPMCLARAGDCASAWRVYQDLWTAKVPPKAPPDTLRKMFESAVTACK